MSFPKRVCSICSEEFELKPDKPGFANRCPACSEEDNADAKQQTSKGASDQELNAARRKAMRDLLYRKDS
jgi:anaerobic ribonucleoside-triphosphate reductase